MTATVNRDDIAWALAAVLPHAGRQSLGLDCIGLHSKDGQLFVYATDAYTVGIARLPYEGHAVSAQLSIGEAKDLERFVRISRKSDEQNNVGLVGNPVSYGYLLGYDDLELHVGLQSDDEEVDSAVFWQRPPVLRQGNLWDAISHHVGSMPERLEVETREYTYNPAFLGRFGKAARLKTDSLRMYPYMVDSKGYDYNVALVTVGDNFLGAIAGMDHRPGIRPVLSTWFKEAA